MALTQHTASI